MSVNLIIPTKYQYGAIMLRLIDGNNIDIITPALRTGEYCVLETLPVASTGSVKIKLIIYISN